MNEPALTITVTGRCTLHAIEQLLADHYQASKEHSHITFDLTKLDWIGHFPAALLFFWVADLATRSSTGHVSVELPPRDALSFQVRKALLDFGVVYRLVELGVTAPFGSAPEPPGGLPLTPVRSRAELWPHLQEARQKLLSAPNLSLSARETIADAFDVILFELGDNAFSHTGGSNPYYQVSLIQSSGPSRPRRGVVSVFDKGVPYVEITVGDLGPGIGAHLTRLMPPDYSPVLSRSASLLKPERVLAYAFEFSVTSDLPGRKQRLEELLAGSVLDPAEVATGLFCVLEMARCHAGQLILRTPTGLLSLDYTRKTPTPIVAGRRKLKTPAPSRLPGSHYYLRIPLQQPPVSSASVFPTTRLWPPSSRPSFEVLGAFEKVAPPAAVTDILHAAICELDRTLVSSPNPGFLVVVPPRYPLPSRAIALFMATMRAVPHNGQILIWHGPRAGVHLPPRAAGPDRRISRLPYGGPPVLVGDLLRNEFQLFGDLISPESASLIALDAASGLFALQSEVFAALQRRYSDHLRQYLQQALKRDNVRHSPGPFLIEGQYYTNCFYQISKALEQPGDVRLFAEWFLRQPEGAVQDTAPDLVISMARGANPLIHALADLFERVSNRRPDILEAPSRPTTMWAAGQVLPYLKKVAVVVTDVICRGERLDDFLTGLIGLRVSRVFAFVDARNQQRAHHRVIVNTYEPLAVPVSAVLEELIMPHEDPPVVLGPAASEDEIDEGEKVYVIDRATNAPTLYVRPRRPQMLFSELLQGAIRESEALFCGHVEAQSRHYSFFLDFPRLFASLRVPLLRWIQDQMDHVSRTTQGDPEPWQAWVYNPDQSLTWLPPSLAACHQRPKVQFVSRAELDAPVPPQPSHPSGNLVIILPCIASGNTARRAIEFGSRNNPRRILVLCVASRMDANNLSFMQRIVRYRDSAFRLACFLQFPLEAYHAGEDTCPGCRDCAELSSTYQLVRDICGASSRLAKAIHQRLATVNPVPLQHDKDGSISLPSATDHELACTNLAALYASAEFDLGDRRALNGLLLADDRNLDLFFEIVGKDKHSRAFRVDELKRRLYKAFSLLRQRALALATQADSRAPLRRLARGVAHLVPEAFVEGARDLLENFLESIPDLEEICFILLSLGRSPQDMGSLLQLARTRNLAEAESLIAETCEAISRRNEPNELEMADAVTALCELWSGLARTNQYTSAIDDLIQRRADETVSREWLCATIDRALKYWERQLSAVVTRVRKSGLWPNLSSHRHESGRRLAALDYLHAVLAEHLKASSDGVALQSKRLEVGSLAMQMRIHHDAIREHLYSFFINPLQCVATDLQEELPTLAGGRLRVSVSVDRTVDPVLCDLEELNAVCREMITNWQKHATSRCEGLEAWFSLYQAGDFVCLEFRDSVGGDFDLSSLGGIRDARKLCERYGGYLDHCAPDASGQKALVMRLRRLPGGVRQETGAGSPFIDGVKR